MRPADNVVRALPARSRHRCIRELLLSVRTIIISTIAFHPGFRNFLGQYFRKVVAYELRAFVSVVAMAVEDAEECVGGSAGEIVLRRERGLVGLLRV